MLIQVYNILYYTRSVFVSPTWVIVNEPQSLVCSLVQSRRLFARLSTIYLHRRIMKRVNFCMRSFEAGWIFQKGIYLCTIVRSTLVFKRFRTCREMLAAVMKIGFWPEATHFSFSLLWSYNQLFVSYAQLPQMIGSYRFLLLSMQIVTARGTFSHAFAIPIGTAKGLVMYWSN